jgi:electron transfer flavoprotein beta subunit
MKIGVIIKQVPDTETKLKISSDQKKIDTSALKWIINPYDEYAIEEAIRFKEKNPIAQTVAFCLGPKSRCADALRTALALGIDEAVLIDTDSIFDSLQTAYVISQAIKSEGEFSFIFSGRSSIDGNSFAIPQMVAEFLNYATLSCISKIEYNDAGAIVHKEIEGGSKEIYQIAKPFLLSVTKGLNTPRYASLPGIMKAKKKPIKEVVAQSLLTDFSSPVSTLESLNYPPDRPGGKIFNKDQVSDLVHALVNDAKVL